MVRAQWADALTLDPRYKDLDDYFEQKAEVFGSRGTHQRMTDVSQWWANAFIVCSQSSDQVSSHPRPVRVLVSVVFLQKSDGQGAGVVVNHVRRWCEATIAACVPVCPL